MKMRLALAVAGLAVGAFLGSAVAQATTYDLAAGFDTANSVGSPWSITYSSGALPHQPGAVNNNHLFPAIPANGFFGTGTNLNNDVPFAFKAAVNGSAANGVSGQTLNNGDFLAGDVVIHTPNDGSDLSIVWKAPAAGVINDLDFAVWYAHSTVARSNDVAFTLGTIVSSWVTSPGSSANRGAAAGLSTTGVNVAADDLLTLTFSKTALQSFGSLTGLSLNFDFVATTPIPAALPLFVSALMGLGWFARRRKEAVPL